jgi:hypothetical protein
MPRYSITGLGDHLSFLSSPERATVGEKRKSRTYLAAMQRRRKAKLATLLLFITALSVDPARKMFGFSGSALSLMYVVVALIYVLALPGARAALRKLPGALPVWMFLLSAWCVIEAMIQHIPFSMALLGMASYVFFVPLVYIGAALMADDHSAAATLRVTVIAGGFIGLGAIASAVLGSSAPAILQPIVPSAGIHDFNSGSIYLAPSIFATAEEAAEFLLIALFSWIALAQAPVGRLGGFTSKAAVISIAIGLIADARRADMAVAVVGVIGLALIRPVAGDVSKAPSSAAAKTRGLYGPTLILAASAVIATVSFLGADKLVPFFTSASDGQNAVTFMFSPSHPAALLGQGTGTSTQGASMLGATVFTGINGSSAYTGYVLDGRSFVTAEGGLTKTWLELGIVGVVLYAGVFMSVLGPVLASLRRIDGIGRALAVLAVALGIVFLKGHQSLDDPLIQPLFWLAAGGAWGRMNRLKGRSHEDREERVSVLRDRKLGRHSVITSGTG